MGFWGARILRGGDAGAGSGRGASPRRPHTVKQTAGCCPKGDGDALPAAKTVSCETGEIWGCFKTTFVMHWIGMGTWGGYQQAADPLVRVANSTAAPGPQVPSSQRPPKIKFGGPGSCFALCLV